MTSELRDKTEFEVQPKRTHLAFGLKSKDEPRSDDPRSVAGAAASASAAGGKSCKGDSSGAKASTFPRDA